MSYNSRRGNASTDPFIELVWKMSMAALILLGAPMLLIGFIGSRQIVKRFPTRQHLIWGMVLGLAAGCLLIGYLLFWPLSQPGSPVFILFVDVARGLRNGGTLDYSRLLQELLPVWAMELLLAPLATVLFGIGLAARPMSSVQLARFRANSRQVATRQASKVAERKLQRKAIPDAITLRRSEPYIVLGVPVEGTLLDWIKKRLFCLPFEFLILHAVVIGASGSGKSETLLRIAIAVAKMLKWQVIYIDAKGDYKAAAKFLVMMREAGITNIRMFPGEHYDGWRGTRDSLLSKLLSIDNVAEVTSVGQHHYATVRENLVEMCVNAPGGPPKSSRELLERLMLTNGLLYDLYNGYGEQQSYLETIMKRPQDALSTYGHYRAFFAKAHGKLDGKWSFDDCDAAYILLDGLAMPEITDGLGRFLLADFVNYTTRKDWDKRTLFIFDEVGSLNLPLYSVFEKVRFRQVSVVVSSQDPSGLARKPGGVGTWDEVRRVLGNSAIKILHRCEDAHEVIRRAGTRSVPQEDYRTDEYGVPNGAGTVRFREELKIDHNDVLRLKVGEAFVIGPGEYERVRVAMRGIDEARWRQLYRNLERKAKEEEPPMPRRQGGPTVVDSTLAPASPQDENATARQLSATSNKANAGKSPPSQKQGQKKGKNRPAAGSKTASRPSGKAAQPRQTQPAPSTDPPVSHDVDETLPFPLPEAPQQPTQPGVLPMWDENGDEDLLP